MERSDRQFPPGYGSTETALLVKWILGVWFVLLIPWLPFTIFSFLMFDVRDAWYSWLYVGSMLAYPVTLSIAIFFRRQIPWLVLVPVVAVAGFCLSAFRPPGI